MTSSATSKMQLHRWNNRRKIMKSVMSGIGLMVVISFIAWGVIGTQIEGSDVANTSSNGSVRLGN